MIPVASTTITVTRAPDETVKVTDPWDDGYADATVNPAFTAVATGVRAVISVGGGNYAGRTVGPGDSEVVNFTLLCDPVDLRYLDEVTDESTGQQYAVAWSINSPGVAGYLASTRAGLSTRKGAGT